MFDRGKGIPIGTQPSTLFSHPRSRSGQASPGRTPTSCPPFRVQHRGRDRGSHTTPPDVKAGPAALRAGPRGPSAVHRSRGSLIMAKDMFVKIGSLKGESTDKNHAGEFDTLSWSWGISNSGSAHQGGGMGAGKARVQDFSFTKYVDKGTPDLMLACCNGKHFDKAVLTVRKAGENPLEYLQITMENLIITNISTGGGVADEGDRLTENVTLNFAKVKVQYKEQTAKGTVGDKPEFGWDIGQNVKQ